MYLLDTDHLSILERGGRSCQKLQARLSQVDATEVGTTIISYEEQTRGWLDRAAKVHEIEAQVRIHEKLERNLILFSRMKMFSFDLAAATEFHQLRHT